MKPLITIITPAYNEEATLPSYFERVNRVIERLEHEYDFEIIITDNGSQDRTFEIVRHQAQRDLRVRGYKLSRNFGYQRSIWTGYAMSRGSAVVELDADLQDPPELIPTMLDAWRRGVHIVYGIRTRRKELWLMSALRKAFYRMIRMASDDDLPSDAGDFLLLDRVIVNHIKSTYDPNIYIRGLVFSLGYRREGIEYARDERIAGRSKFKFGTLLRLAMDGFVRHSTIPLRLAYYSGFAFCLFSVGLIGIYLIGKLALGHDWPAGFATTTIIQLISIGINSMLLGLLGEYLSRSYAIQRRFPMSIIEEATGDAEANEVEVDNGPL